MSLSETAQHVWTAIQTLYTNSPTEQQAASQWLNDFAERHEAPSVALELLAAGHPAEVQFFSANMLLTAVRRRWARLDPGLQQQVQQKLRHELSQRAGEPGALAWMAQQRLILACASIAATSGGNALAGTVSRAVEMAKQGHTQVAVELLTATAEAVTDLQRRRRDAATEVLQPLAGGALAVVLHSLRDPQSKAQLRLGGLRCLLAWLQLGSPEGAEALMPLATFRSEQREVWEALLEHLAHPDEDVAAAATQAVVFLLNMCEVVGGHQAEEAAAREVAAAAVRLGAGGQQADAAPLHCAAQVAAALAGRNASAVAQHIPEAVPLATVALQALASGHQGAAEAAIEYFDALSGVPVAQRQPPLQQPVFESMLPHLAHAAAYSPDFTGWQDASDEDSDAFHSFRDNVLGDALDTCQKLLGRQYLQHFAAALRDAPDWQAAEAALFALKLYRRKGGSSPAAGSGAPADEEDALLGSLFSHVTSAEGHLRSNACCMDAAAQLLSANSGWLAAASPALFQAALGYALACLRRRDCAAAGASAFEFLCRATPAAAAGNLFDALLPAVLPTLQGTDTEGPSWEDRAEAVKGLIALAAGRPASLPADARAAAAAATAAAAQRLVLPLAEGAEALARQPQGQGWEAAAAGHLLLVSTALQRLDFLSLGFEVAPEASPAAALAAGCLPRLESLSQLQPAVGSPAVAAALAQALRRCLEALGPAGGGALGGVLQALGRAFPAEPRACLEALSAAAELSREWPAAAASLAGAVSQVGATVLPHVQAESADPELAAAWFTLLARSLEGEQPLLPDAGGGAADIAAEHFPAALGLLGRREEAVMRSLITFLKAALAVERPEASERGKACLQAHGEALLVRLLRAVVATCPQLLLSPLARFLHVLLNHALYGAAAREWFGRALATDAVIGEALGPEERQAACRTALGLPPNRAGLFLSVVKDMAAVARKEMDADVLHSYDV